MKASDLVFELNKLISEHGDFLIGIRDHVNGNDKIAINIIVEKLKGYGFYYEEETKKIIGEIADSFVIE